VTLPGLRNSGTIKNLGRGNTKTTGKLRKARIVGKGTREGRRWGGAAWGAETKG